MTPHRPVTITPKNGGRLATDVSANEVGLANYRVKRDWRRFLDREIRREGYDIPLPSPEFSPINLIYRARSANRKNAIIVGTRNALYRYFSTEDGWYVDGLGEFYYFAPDDPYVVDSGADTPYVLDGGSGDYFSDEYVREDWDEWLQIGTGFSADGDRWEVAAVGDDLVFNNGVDLPVSYRLNQFEVAPLYELREQGIASVGTICEYNSILKVGDVRQIKQDRIKDVFNVIDLDASAAQAGAQSSGGSKATQEIGSKTVEIVSGSFTFDAGMVGKRIRFRNGFSSKIVSVDTPTQIMVEDAPEWAPDYEGNIALAFRILESDDSDRRVVAGHGVFTEDMVGRTLYWDHGAAKVIVGFVDSTTVLVDDDMPVESGRISVENPRAFATITEPEYVNRRAYRTAWSALGAATRWAAVVPCSLEAGSRTLNLEYPVKSFGVGMEVLVVGAGPEGGNLIANVIMVREGGKRLILDAKASTTVTDSLVQANDTVGSIVGFEDLEDDGSAILRMMELNGRLVIYREGGYQLAQYTGIVGSPFDYSDMVPTKNRLFFKHSLVNVTFQGNNFHVFAGERTFYQFDMLSRLPREFEPFHVCKNVFFDQVKRPGGVDHTLVFSAENSLTKEVFFCFPSSGDDKALIFDYEQGTVSTTSGAFTAGGMVLKPGSDTEEWYLMGTAGGLVLRYGLTQVYQEEWQGDAMWNRSGSEYTSELYSGLGDFGHPHNEKHLRCFVPEVSSFTDDTPVKVELYGATNPNSGVARNAESLLASKVIAEPSVDNLFSCHFTKHYFADRIIVEGKDNPCELSARTYDVQIVKSQSATRRTG